MPWKEETVKMKREEFAKRALVCGRALKRHPKQKPGQTISRAGYFDSLGSQFLARHFGYCPIVNLPGARTAPLHASANCIAVPYGASILNG